MREVKSLRSFLRVATLVLFALASCKNKVADIPFPFSDSLFPQPVNQPLVFSKARKLEWVVNKSGGINSIKRKLDLDALPASPFDTFGFKSLHKSPDILHFDFKSLRDTVLDLNKIPSLNLKFKTYVLPPPVLVKSALISRKSGTNISISDLGTGQGITDKIIFSILQDRNGFIWIGTDKGLYRFDGEYTQVYENFTAGAVNLIEDTDGHIWFINNSNIGMIDLKQGTVSISSEITTISPQIPKMILDVHGLIWISRISNLGVSIIDPKTKTYKHLDRSTGLAGIYKWGIYEDGNKNIWLTGANGIEIINAERNKIHYLNKINGLGNDTVRAITGDKNGIVWVAFHHGGVDAVDIKQGIITAYGAAQGIDNTATYRLAIDQKNKVWMSTSGSLVCLDPDRGLYKYFNSRDGIPEDYILDIMIDDHQRLWVGSYSGGVSVIEQEGETTHPVGEKSLSTLLEDSKGKIWVGAGTSNDGIEILDKEKKKAYVLNRQQGLGDNFIQNIIEVDGKIWISTNGGADIIDPLHKTIEHFGKKEGLTSDSLYNLLKDKKGNIWFSGPAMGIDRYDTDSKILFHAGVKEGLSENFISDFKTDRKGRVWIATNSMGIDVYDPEKGTIENFNNAPGLMDKCNRSLLLDQNDRMWIGTDKGIYIADINKGILTTITTEQGLCNNYITSLSMYKESILAGTLNRISIIKPPHYINTPADSNKLETGWKIATLKGSDGLINSSTNWNTNIITREGEYYWGDIGISIIHGIQEDTSQSPVLITGLSIMNEKQNFNDPVISQEVDTVWTADSFYLKGQIPANRNLKGQQDFHWDAVSGPFNLPENLIIPYNQNYIQFQFGQQNVGVHEPAVYSYILEGIDKKWSSNTVKTFTDNYLNLSPGNYTFKVCGKDGTGLWSKPASFSFTILPPWWQTWWMYCIYLIGLAGAIFGYNKYRSKALLKENSLLEEKIQSRTIEVKQQADELKTINQISQALVSQADLNDLIKLVGDQLKDLFKANIVYIALLDKKTKMISFPYQYGDNMQPLKLGEGLTSKIILSGEPLLINKDVHEQASELGINRVGLPASSYLGVPIPVSDEIIGVLSIQSTEKENRFVEKDKNLLTTIAANVGVAIRKARLFEEVKRANTDADAARKNAEEANAAKSAFLSTVSHELRTPLTSVLGFTRITKKRLEEKIFPVTDKSDPKTVKAIEQISGNLNVVIAEGERLTNLINDVLDLAKIEAGKMEWNMESVQFPEVLERAISATSALFDQKNLRLERKVEENLPEISGDRDKLIQVVVNLLSNAVKFTNDGVVTCSVYQKEGALIVGITDTGIGIAPEDHDKVFEQFKQVGDTLTDKPKGTGLGLPICKEIVEHHHGKIWLESELGKGSTFYFMLPAISPVDKATGHMQFDDLLRQLKKRVEQSHPSIKNNNATILVVDDDDGIRSLLKQELGEAGYNIEEAANGKEAIEKIRNNRPDLVILDVMMPEMNGFDVAAILKNDPHTMEIPIIILSIVQDKSRGFRIGVDRYLTKPIDTGLLFSEIGHLLEQGKSKKKVLVVDEDSVIIRTLADVLEAKGYQVVESDGKELVEKAIATQPDIIILNSVISDKDEIVKSIRFEKGLENVLFLIYQ